MLGQTNIERTKRHINKILKRTKEEGIYIKQTTQQSKLTDTDIFKKDKETITVINNKNNKSTEHKEEELYKEYKEGELIEKNRQSYEYTKIEITKQPNGECEEKILDIQIEERAQEILAHKEWNRNIEIEIEIEIGNRKIIKINGQFTKYTIYKTAYKKIEEEEISTYTEEKLYELHDIEENQKTENKEDIEKVTKIIKELIKNIDLSNEEWIVKEYIQ